MAEEQKPSRSPDDAEIEQEILLDRKFSLEEAIGRLAGGGLLKGDSPVPKMRQAEFEIERYLEQHLIDSEGALQVVLVRRVSNSELVLNGEYDQPLLALALVTEQLLSSEPLLQDFVQEVDREWGRMFRERPYLQQADSSPHPDDPYTYATVRSTLSALLRSLRGE